MGERGGAGKLGDKEGELGWWTRMEGWGTRQGGYAYGWSHSIFDNPHVTPEEFTVSTPHIFPSNTSLFIPPLTCLGLFPPSFMLSLLTVSLFILTLRFNYSFVLIVFIIVWIIIVPCFCCQKQVVDRTCKGSVCVCVSVILIRTCGWGSLDPDKDTPPGGSVPMKWGQCGFFLKECTRAQRRRQARRHAPLMPHEWYMPAWSYSNRTPH